MIFRALFLRPLMHRPWRFAVTVLGVAAGVAAVVATVAASRAAIASFAEGVEEVAGAARLEVTRPGGLPESLLAELRPITDEAVVVPVVEESVLLVELGDGVRLLGVDLLLDAQVRPVLAAGAAPQSMDAVLLGFGAVISRALADQLSVGVGDRLTVSANGRAGTIEVAAIFDGGNLSAVWERVVLMDVAAAQELLNRVDRLDRIELVPRADVDLGRLRARAMEFLPPDVSVAEPSERRRFAEQMLASLRFNLVALSAISVLVGGRAGGDHPGDVGGAAPLRGVALALDGGVADPDRGGGARRGDGHRPGWRRGRSVRWISRCALRVGKHAVHRGLGGAGHSCVRDPFRTLARRRRRGAGLGHGPGGFGSALARGGLDTAAAGSARRGAPALEPCGPGADGSGCCWQSPRPSCC